MHEFCYENVKDPTYFRRIGYRPTQITGIMLLPRIWSRRGKLKE